MTSSPVTWVIPEMNNSVATPTTGWVSGRVSGRVTGRVTVIIVSYNSIKDVDVCLTSVLKQDYPDFEVILSDNGSTDGTVERVRTQYPRVKILQNNANLGYANGINAALPLATGEYIAPLNVDTEVKTDWLAAMVKVWQSDPESVP